MMIWKKKRHWDVRKYLSRDCIINWIVAWLLAIMLVWSVRAKNKASQKPQTLSGVNVELQLPPGVVCDQGNTVQVQLQVHGADRQMTADAWQGTCTVSCPVKNLPLVQKVKLTPEMFRTRYFGVTIDLITPSSIDLKLDKLETRNLPIRHVFDSVERLPEGYGIGRVFVYPGEVTVSGPSSVVNVLQQVRTKPVPLDGSTREGFDFVAELQELAGVKMQPDRVTMHVGISRKILGERSFSGIPCYLLLSPELRRGFSAELAPGTASAVDVMVKGEDEARAALQPGGIRVFADLAGLKSPGEYTVPLTGVFLFPGTGKLEITRISPARVNVVIRRK